MATNVKTEAQPAGAGGGGEGKLTANEVVRKATELLHSILPPAPPVLIADILHSLRSAIAAGPKKEPAPKDLADAVSKIDALVGKMDPPLEHKPDFKAMLEATKAPPPPPVPAVDAPSEPQAAKAS